MSAIKNIQNILGFIDTIYSYQEQKEEREQNKEEIKTIRNFLNIRNINNDINNNNQIIKNIMGNGGITNMLSSYITNYINNYNNYHYRNEDENIENKEEVFYECESYNNKTLYFCECSDEIQKNRTECVICIENIKDFDKVIITQCKHVFHVDCIETWLRNTKTCPTCRREITQD